MFTIYGFLVLLIFYAQEDYEHRQQQQTTELVEK